MDYSRVNSAISRCVDELVEAGASRDVIEQLVSPLELRAVQSIIDNQRDQLLLNFENKSAALAERFNVNERTIRKWRKSALNRPSRSATRSA